MNFLKRQNEKNIYQIKEKGTIKNVDKEKINKKLKIDEVIRLSEEEYKFISRDKEIFTHFNLQWCDHIPGRNYALVKIVKKGYYKQNGEEILPIISFDDGFIVHCIDVKNGVSYEDINEKNFEYSFNNIKSTDDLKKIILRRYSKSMPDLTEEEILSLGVSITTLKIIRRI
ncbi:MAG: hypothetical protein ABH824_03235 [Nanoarchaeota archaeon]|nr:hypothetical protein [Nanoarchaeota archaeon]MBU1631888.1 hypothetical protein [Nanoarchaeota archaeon]MBU1875925.1 hypothetical protein [Nanoarchaeota archaeon]